MVSQGLLFSEPSIAETGVWCCLSDGIDPAEWANLCRYIGTLNPMAFEQLKNKIVPITTRSMRNYRTEVSVDMPLVSIGPSGLGGQYQVEASM
jgi:hypothetical protein